MFKPQRNALPEASPHTGSLPKRNAVPQESSMTRQATLELEDGRIIKGEVLTAVNLGNPAVGPRYEIELRINGVDTFVWKQLVDGGQLLHIDD